MSRTMRTLVTVGVVTIGLATAAWAITGKNGYTASTVLAWNSIKGQVVYPTTFNGVEWANLSVSDISDGLGGNGGGEIAANSAGVVYFLAGGRTALTSTTNYRGLLSFDGQTCRSLAQTSYTAQEGASLADVAVSPVTSGLLGAGNPLVLRQWHSGGTPNTNPVSEVVTIDPATLAETVLYTHTGNYLAAVAAANDGTVYALDAVAAKVLRLTWNSATSAYTASQVSTTLAPAEFLHVGPDGALYTGKVGDGWQGVHSFQMTDKSICRLVPSTGAWSVYATIPSTYWAYDVVWDSAGVLRVVVQKTYKGTKSTEYQVSPALDLSSRSMIGSSTFGMGALAAGPSGTVYVHEIGSGSTGSLINALTR